MYLTDTEKALIYELVNNQIQTPQGLEPSFLEALEDLRYSLELDMFKSAWEQWREEYAKAVYEVEHDL